MKMIPPAMVNEQVAKDKLHWLNTQPHSITIDKDKIDQDFLDRLSVTTATHDDVVIASSEFVIDDRTKEFILFELQKILAFNGFESELLADDCLQVSKGYWKLDIKHIRSQLPFSGFLLHQIEQAYKHQYENSPYSSHAVKVPRYEYPSRLYLDSIKQTIIDNTDGEL